MDLEGEGLDRVGNDLRLPPDQVELIEAVAAVQPRTIVILIAGSAISMRGWGDLVPSLLTAWYPGEKGGLAIGEALFGSINPSGKLPITFPVDVNQIPSHAGFGGKDARYDEGIFIGYRHQDHNDLEPLFPFGHGLSYTTFAYRGLQLDVRGEGDDVAISATFEIENTGQRAGVEIAQLYVADLEASQPRPPKELKGFARVELDPGERETVTLELDWSDLAFWSPEIRDWTAEPGEFEVLIGASSRDLRLRGEFELPRPAGAPGATRGL
jgi:beta-glucosidase